jgi:hypothetical protein
VIRQPTRDTHSPDAHLHSSSSKSHRSSSHTRPIIPNSVSDQSLPTPHPASQCGHREAIHTFPSESYLNRIILSEHFSWLLVTASFFQADTLPCRHATCHLISLFPSSRMFAIDKKSAGIMKTPPSRLKNVCFACPTTLPHHQGLTKHCSSKEGLRANSRGRVDFALRGSLTRGEDQDYPLDV